MYWLRYLLKEPYRTLSSNKERTFLQLLARYADKPRHQEIKASFDGLVFRVPDPLSFVWQYKEIFADECYAFPTTKKSPIILDCGANIGMSVAFFKKYYPSAHIFAYEASPEIASMLKANLLSNNLHDKVEVVEKAVWSDNQGIAFGNMGDDSSSIFQQENKVMIPSIRLKDVLDNHESIDFLKIDIEGAETEVLNDCGDSLYKVQNMFVEFHSYIGQPQTLSDVIKVLEMNEFRYHIDTFQHRKKPFYNRRYQNNDVMDLQLNISAYR